MCAPRWVWWVGFPLWISLASGITILLVRPLFMRQKSSTRRLLGTELPEVAFKSPLHYVGAVLSLLIVMVLASIPFLYLVNFVLWPSAPC